MARKLTVTAILGLAAGLVAATPGAAVVPEGFSDVVVFGDRSVHIDQDVVVTSGDIVANRADPDPQPPPPGLYELFFDKRATTAGSLRGDSVFVGRNATVGGDVAFNELDAEGTIAGAEITPLALPVFDVLPLFFTGAADGPDVSVGKNGTETLAPGDYGAIVLDQGATLHLTGGVYDVRSIETVNKQARITFGAPSEVRVAETLRTAKEVFLGPADGSGVAASEIVFYVAGEDEAVPPGTAGKKGKPEGAGDEGGEGEPDGSGDAAKPEAVRIDMDSTVAANFYAPNGSIRIEQRTTATGAFLGRTVRIDRSSEITLDTFFVNRPPVAGDDSATVAEGGTVATLDSGETSLLANDTDPNGDDLSVSPTPVSPPAHGAVVLSPDGTFTYTHDGSETTADGFEYEVCDDGVEPGPLCDTGAVAITVIPVNDAPVADPQSLTTPEDTFVDITLTGSDVEGDVLTFSIGVEPANGTLQNLTQVPPTSATVRYLPASDFVGTDSFDFQVDDGNGGIDTATVTITVEDVNAPPVARSDSAIVEPGGTVTTLVGGASSVLANDTDPDGDTLTVTTTPVSGPSNGTLTLNADGTFSYTHDGGSSTSDQFVYEVCDDGSPVACSTASVLITVRALEITVTVTKSGPGAADSTVVSSPSGIDCGSTCSAQFTTDQQILLTAEPADGFAFDFWAGDADCGDGLLTPSADVSCEAVFKDAPPPPVGDAEISISKAGDGSGRVTSDPTGIDCGTVCTASFPAFTNVTLSASAAADSRFVGFGGDPDCSDGVVGMDADKSCIATFELLPTNTFELTVTKAGTGGGTVASSPSGIQCGTVCAADYEAGTAVTLFVRPEPDSTFVGWGGDCTGTGFSTTVTMDADKTCSAEFQ